MILNKTISKRLIAANLFAVLVAMVGGGFGIFSLQNSISSYQQELRELQDAETEILRAESHFKIQVQEWKDVLLRGKSPLQLEKYWKSFENEEAMVVKTVSAVESSLPAGSSRQLLGDFLIAHKKLSTEYRKGLEAFQKSGGNPYVADAVVIGIDRAPITILDNALEEINKTESTVQADVDAKARTALITSITVMILAFIGALVVFAVLIRKAKQIEEELSIAAVAFESREGIIVTEVNNIIVRVNRSFTELTGYEAGDVLGKRPTLLQSGRHGADFYTSMWNSIQRDGFWQGEIWNRRKSGEIYPEWLTVTAVRDSKGKIKNYVGSFSDITRRVADEAEIRNLAFFDPLTGLANRRLLTDHLAHAFALSSRSRSFGALLFIDLDRFKELNDTLGHAQGDQLLELVAERLSVNVREEDTVSRFGGDEFVVLLEELGSDRSAAAGKAIEIAEKLRAKLGEPYKLQTAHEKDWNCTPSIGVALFLGHDEEVDAVLAQADKALYAAKEAGRNTVRLANI